MKGKGKGKGNLGIWKFVVKLDNRPVLFALFVLKHMSYLSLRHFNPLLKVTGLALITLDVCRM